MHVFYGSSLVESTTWEIIPPLALGTIEMTSVQQAGTIWTCPGMTWLHVGFMLHTPRNSFLQDGLKGKRLGHSQGLLCSLGPSLPSEALLATREVQSINPVTIPD